MKKLVLITGLVLFGCLFIGELSSSEKDISPQEQTATYAAAEQTDSYVIKSSRGRLAVYRSGEAQPFMTTETLTSALPKSDMLRLEKGIEVSGKEQLRRLLEDYCS